MVSLWRVEGSWDEDDGWFAGRGRHGESGVGGLDHSGAGVGRSER